jgi:hypothetical protein
MSFAAWPGTGCPTPLERAIATHGEWIGTQLGGLPGLGSSFPFPLPLPPPASRPPPPTTDDVPPRARDLWLRINTYRYRHGLDPIDLSPALSLVAATHVRDLETSPQRPGCNGHSWTDRGSWTPCCYTDDHAQAACMWRKPREIARFDANGYEISIGSPGVRGGAPLDGHRAVKLWSSSPAHDDVMLERGVWAKMRWRALGVSISDSHASAWFADAAEAPE